MIDGNYLIPIVTFVLGIAFYHWLMGQAGFVARFVRGRIEKLVQKRVKKFGGNIKDAINDIFRDEPEQVRYSMMTKYERLKLRKKEIERPG